ncbi:FkbM family methyltransferase [Fulvivirgaceae bacterium BMA12]|uniref:FkbM family methyltransferase n=1 Tax=Agaribacillus aureus TaxID=3051825 RepID=A0ABT8LDW6_9BACT|nr:FkbM family methyltransferase [Fulvivirgaceae bacterium BMA12]
MKTERIDGFEVSFRENTSDENVIEHSFENDIFFKALPDYKPDKNDVIIDVGAHIGTFSLLAAKKVPQGKVYAIEASRETYDILSDNISNNALNNVTAFNLALSDLKGTTELYHSEGNWGHSIMKKLTDKCEKVETESLENFLGSNDIQKCDLIKFNCEGAEFKIVLGASLEDLSKFKRMVLLYHNDLSHDNHNENELANKLNAAGFYTHVLRKTDKRGWIIANNKRDFSYFQYLRFRLIRKLASTK